MRLRRFSKLREPNQICAFCAVKYGLEFQPAQSLQSTRLSRHYHGYQKLSRPTNAAAIAQQEDWNRRVTPQPKQQKLYERLQPQKLVRGGPPEETFSTSSPPSEKFGGQESAFRSQKKGVKPQGLPAQAKEVDDAASSSDDDSWGAFANDGEITPDSEPRSTQTFSDKTDSKYRGLQAGPHGNNQRLQKEESGSLSGESKPMAPIRRQWVKESLVKRRMSDIYPSEPNANFGYRDGTINKVRSLERASDSLSSGMSMLESWARDPRARATDDSEKLQDFELTSSRYSRRPSQSSSTPNHRGRMSVLDNNQDSWNGSRASIANPNSPILGNGTKSEYRGSAFGSAALAYQERKDEEARQAYSAYRTKLNPAARQQSTEQDAPEIATQQNFGGRTSTKNTKVAKSAETNPDFGVKTNTRRTEYRRGSLTSRHLSRRDKGDDEGYSKHDKDFDEVEDEKLQRRKKNPKGRKQSKPGSFSRPIQLPEFITVERLSAAMNVELGKFVNALKHLGYENPAYDHILDYENSSLICQEFNFEPIAASQETSDLNARPPPDPEILVGLPHRPPIVTIMGHVDHGKTTILDWLRKSSVAAAEHGGITQHIGAFSVRMPGSEKTITFLDTPGHAAFLEMRRRGANVTDIVILVVAADDSVKPQTLEAIKHAQESKVAIIVAINKVDKEDANVERVKQDLARHGIDVESFGGDTQAVVVSGKTGLGMVDLEEAIIAEAENLQTQVEFEGPAEGWVIESSMGAGGRLATVLVRRGTLRRGDIVVAGEAWSRVRSLRNDAGVMVDSAPPGTPVVVDGWREPPAAGAEVLQAESESQAKAVIDLRVNMQERAEMAKDASAINAIRREEAEARVRRKAWESEQEWSKLPSWRQPNDNVGWVESTNKDIGGPKRIDILVKADVAGSVEAVMNAVSSIGNNEIATNVIDSGVGPVNESDIEYLAATGSEGYIISFNQQNDGGIVRRAEAAGVPILSHKIIYKVTDDLTTKLADKLAPIFTQKVQGEAEVNQVFTIDTGRKGATKIAGCKVANGLISRDRKVRVLRSKEVVFTGMLGSLKHMKKDVTEMRAGTECGMGFEGWNDFKVGDQIQSFDEKREKRRL